MQESEEEDGIALTDKNLVRLNPPFTTELVQARCLTILLRKQHSTGDILDEVSVKKTGSLVLSLGHVFATAITVSSPENLLHPQTPDQTLDNSYPRVINR